MTKVYTDPEVARYHTPGHPESPQRVLKSAQRLQAAGYTLHAPDAAVEDTDVLAVHSPAHLEHLRDPSAGFDPDTPAYPGIDRIAMISASGALCAMRAALRETPAFSLMRPPGHHAGRERIAGFCYLNNLAIAAARALGDASVKRVAILDIDVHHGDGTQNIVSGRADIRFCSLHQSPLYPGSGIVSDGNCLNFPLPPGTAEAAYLAKLEEAIATLLDFKPDLLAVSAGFDTYKECPIANLRLETSSYERLGKLIAETGLRRFAVLEGGYAEALPENIESFLAGFSA